MKMLLVIESECNGEASQVLGLFYDTPEGLESARECKGTWGGEVCIYRAPVGSFNQAELEWVE